MAVVPAFKKLKNDLKDNCLPNFCILTGEEDYLIDWAASEIISSLLDDSLRVFDFSKFDSENISLKELQSTCETLPISSPKRVVLINGTPDSGIDEYIKTAPDTCLIIIKSSSLKKTSAIYKYAKKIGGDYNFDKLDRGLLFDFVKKEFKSHKKNVDIAAINQLIDMSGYLNKSSNYSLYDFKNDIKKLCDYADLDTINISHVADIITPSVDDNIFEMIEAAVKGETKAFDLLFGMLQNKNSEFMIMASLVSHFDLMLMSKELYENGCSCENITDMLGIHPFRAKKIYRSVADIELKKIRSLLKSALLMESQVKNGEIDSTLALSAFLLENKK